MCGRYMMTSPIESVIQLFQVYERLNLPPRYNIAPTQDVPVVRHRQDGAGRELVMMRWGLVPFWAKDIKIGYKMINAKAETVDSKPAFRNAYREHRCLIVADGFFEWKKQGKTKQPMLIHMKDDSPFAFAGLWQRWTPKDDESIESCTIITTDACKLVAPIHDRMPVILDPADYDAWLDPGAADGKALLKPCPDDWLEAYAVNTRVNNVKNDDPGCIEPVEA